MDMIGTSSSLLNMQSKRLHDTHGDRSFLSTAFRAGNVASSGRLYGLLEDVAVPYRRMGALNLVDGQWVLERAWIDNVEINGTGRITLPSPGGRVFLRTDASIEWGYVPPTNEEGFGTSYLTGDYRVLAASIVIVPSGQSRPPDSDDYPGETGGFWSRTTYREIFSINSAGLPNVTTGIGWLFYQL